MAGTTTVSLPQLAKLIDHSLLHPTLTDAEVASGLEVSRSRSVAAACVKPCHVPLAARLLAGSDVVVCAVVGFPHGSSSTAVKVYEAAVAANEGATEIDMVVNVGKVLGADWGYVEDEIRAVNAATTGGGGILKVIFENDFLNEGQIVKLCEICTRVGVAFVKTSTGYGFVKLPNGFYSYKGATVPHLKLMREHSGPSVRVKAAGGIRTLDDFLCVASLGVERVGLSATEAILDEAKRRGIGDAPVEVELKVMGDAGGVY